jgi:hypothetical protein
MAINRGFVVVVVVVVPDRSTWRVVVETLSLRVDVVVTEVTVWRLSRWRLLLPG